MHPPRKLGREREGRGKGKVLQGKADGGGNDYTVLYTPS